MTEITTNSVEKTDFVNQKTEKIRSGHAKNFHFTISQQEALRRATLLKHRKVSTQLKLDMVQRQLSDLRNSSSTDRQFYRSQLTELSDELQDLGNTLEKVERSAFYARRRMLRCYGGGGSLQLSASHPAIYSSSETLDQSSKNGLKSRMHHLMPSPTLRTFRKKHLLGELRSAASCSSLHVKSTPHSSCDDIATKDTKVWKAPLRFLGHIVDNRICRKIWGSAKRTKSQDNVAHEEPKARRSLQEIDNNNCNGLRKKDDDYLSSSSSESESSDESDDENKEWDTRKMTSKHIWKGPVERRVSNSQKQQIDPALLAEIEDFEKMAAQYIKLHT